MYGSAIFRWVDAMLGSLEKFQLKTISVAYISLSALFLSACQSSDLMQAQPTHAVQLLKQQKVSTTETCSVFLG